MVTSTHAFGAYSRVGPNPSLKRTHHGMPRLGLISFWPKRVLPRCAA